MAVLCSSHREGNCPHSLSPKLFFTWLGPSLISGQLECLFLGGGVGGGWGFCVGQGSPSCCEWVGNPALPVPPGASSAGLSRGCRCLTLPELIRTHTCHLSPSRDPMSPRLPPASVPVGCGVGAPTTASPDGENSKPGSDCWGHTAGWRQGCTEPRAGVPKTLALSASHAQRGRLRSPG